MGLQLTNRYTARPTAIDTLTNPRRASTLALQKLKIDLRAGDGIFRRRLALKVVTGLLKRILTIVAVGIKVRQTGGSARLISRRKLTRLGSLFGLVFHFLFLWKRCKIAAVTG